MLPAIVGQSDPISVCKPTSGTFSCALLARILRNHVFERVKGASILGGSPLPTLSISRFMISGTLSERQ